MVNCSVNNTEINSSHFDEVRGETRNFLFFGEALVNLHSDEIRIRNGLILLDNLNELAFKIFLKSSIGDKELEKINFPNLLETVMKKKIGFRRI